jgi:phospholipase C
MNFRSIASNTLFGVRIALASIALLQFTIGTGFAGDTKPAEANFPRDNKTASPIKHVIVIIGENRSFDHVFATYVPKGGQSVDNLLSKRIIQLDANKNAIAGPHFDKAQQLAATDIGTFLLNPPTEEFPSNVLPAPLVGGPTKGPDGYFAGSEPCGVAGVSAVTCAELSEDGLPFSIDPATGQNYYQDLASGGSSLTKNTPDTRIANVESLPAGPFQLTGPTFTYNDYAQSPVHRFYQMWQQLNCAVEHASDENPSGCNGKLTSWVEVTEGAGANGVSQPPICTTGGDATPCFTTNYLLPSASFPDQITTEEGSTALAFYNVQKGDAAYFKSLADNYAMSDNFHQSVDGGTGANHIMLGHGDAIFFTDADGKPAVPPNNNAPAFTETYMSGPNPDQGLVNEVENPNPAPGTNNWYLEDGYGTTNNEGFPPPYTAEPVSGGGSYSDCSDTSQPGVGEIVNYLESINIAPHCEKNRYYLLNNYNPGWFGNGKNAYIDQNPANTPFTIPPSSVRSIGDELNSDAISWKYYGDQWNNYVNDPYQLNYGTNGPDADEYCNICNPFQYDTSIMSHPEQVKAHIQDTVDLYGDIVTGTLPAVSVVKPSGYVDGHPSSSKLDLFEGFVKKIVDMVQNSTYAKDTAILITFDEGGGYYDSGYVQPLDFFGDGTRIPMMVVSYYTKAGHISHDYADHVSILKFIERNWGIGTVTSRSRDNFPNPKPSSLNPYVPTNSPAISDLWDLFDFSSK